MKSSSFNYSNFAIGKNIVLSFPDSEENNFYEAI
ncbi:hypothetical protein ACVWYG_001459 [Pedobacter sp. UYEF25]